MKKTTKTQNLKNSNTLFKTVILNLFQDLTHGKISREISKDKLLLMHWPSFTIGQMLKRVQHDNKKITKDVKISYTRKKGETINVSKN